MFRIDEEKTIHLTRGDIANIKVSATKTDGTPHTFLVGDVVRIKVVKKKDYGSVVMQKYVEVAQEGTQVSIYLTKDETKFGEVISKPTTYWYEVELNPNTTPQTIIGSDEDGDKQFILYPEGSDEQ